mgnify:CR=1 FL=1
MTRSATPYPFKSIRSLFLAAIILLIATVSLPLLVSGVKIINSITYQFGLENLHDKMQSCLEPINLHYQTLTRVGLEDSRSHRQEIKDEAYAFLRSYQYKETGSVFVVSREGDLIISTDFSDTTSADYRRFIDKLQPDTDTIEYQVGGRQRIGVVRYYRPWQSYIGLAMDRRELFAPRDLFVKINVIVLAVVLAIAALFTLAIHLLLIRPIIRLSHFADQLSKGDLQARVRGRFILELATMKADIIRMVATLISREEKYRAVFNAPGDAIFIHDAGSGKILEANNTVAEMYGYDPMEILQVTVGDISAGYHPYTMEEAAKRVARVESRRPQRFEWHARRRSGELFWVDVSLRGFDFGGRHCVLAVVRDIEAQKEAARELAAEKEQLAITLRSIGEGVITTDAKGDVILVNRVAEHLTGWNQAEAAGRPLVDIFKTIHTESGRLNPDPSREVLRKGIQAELLLESMLVARDGTRRYIADSAAPIRNLSSEVVGVVLVFRDISEKLRMEQEILKIKKLESVGVLAGGIAHDFNNLLAAILGNINLARRQCSDHAHGDQLLSEAEKACLRARNLTQQLLTFSKGGEPVRQTSDLAEIIRDNAGFVLRGTPVALSFNPPPDLRQVEIDPGQIGQVIQNIVLNARQAMQTQGDLVEIEADNCRNCREPEFSSDCVRITIRDNGPGMEQPLLDKIFDPYFTTKEKGSGLGLAICHSIIKKHGGIIQVNSEPGQGTVFTLKLPASKQESHRPPAPVDQPAGPNRLKILIMDDEQMIRSLAMEIFTALGHEPHTTPDGASALAAYAEAMNLGTPFDLVIMDLTIPGGMGGKEAVGKILAMNAAARVVVASGYSNDPVMAHYHDHGFVGMLVKPFRIVDLEKVIAEIFAASP